MTIDDIARLANTSIATVSRVINNDAHVSPETRKKVQRVIEATNYRPNAAGKNLRTNKTYNVLAVLPTITNPFFSTVIDGLSDLAAQNGYSLTFVVSNRDVNKEKEFLKKLISKVVDGIVLFYTSMDIKTLEGFSKKYPIACIGATGTTKVSRAGINDFDAAYDATKYLQALGHKSIVVLRDEKELVFNAEREKGFRVAMRRAGLPVDESMILRCRDQKDAENFALELFRREMPPTAIFSFSDVYAIAVIKRLSEEGVRVGRDMDVMGFDNIEFSKYVTPSLTTVAQPGYQLGQSAFTLLQEKIENITSISKEIIFPHEIIERESTSQKRK